MEMTKKQVLIAVAATIVGCLIFIWLFALPVKAEIGSITVSSLSSTAYEETVVPYYLDSLSENYIEDVDHFIEGYDPQALVTDYREIYIVFDMTKYTPVEFTTLWVSVEDIPEKYADNVVCVMNGPLMTQPETSKMQGNITLIVKRNGLTDEQIEQMAKDISYSIKWGLAMGIDGYVYA